MFWSLSHRADPKAVAIADRHYNRQKIGSSQFVPPGKCFVLWAPGAVWVTSWPFAKYVKHQWAGAWVNSIFRNEEPALYLSSELIKQAIAATRFEWPVPDEGLITFVDGSKVRHKRDLGRCYRRAGFIYVGETKGGLVALQIKEVDMPRAESALPYAAEWS